MKNEFETIRYNDNIPAKLEFCSGRIETQNHWHKELELIYVCDGQLDVFVYEKRFKLEKYSVFLINVQEVHKIIGEAEYLSIHISDEFTADFGLSVEASEFEITAGSDAENEIRNLMWQLERTQSETSYPELLQSSLISSILYILFTECRSEKQTRLQPGAQISSRNAKIAVDYINRHYRGEISQTEVAKLVGVHPAYFSKYFKNEVGVVFTEYVSQVRLRHALDALLNQNLSVEQSAKAGGFPSTRNFITKCKRACNLTPAQLKAQKQSR